MRVLKYKIPEMVARFTIDMPQNSKILSFQLQDGLPVIWVLGDDSPGYQKHFTLVGTGIETGNSLSQSRFIGTIQHGFFVWHLFEDIIEELENAEV